MGKLKKALAIALWHYWAEDIDGARYDPLAADWDEAPAAYDRQGVTSESSILRELEHFLQPFNAKPTWEPVYPLRFELGHELLDWPISRTE